MVFAAVLLLLVGAAAAVPMWSNDRPPDTVATYDDSDCSDPSDCLLADDDAVVTARDHAIHGSTPIVANRTDPVPADAVLQDINLNVKLETDSDASASVQVWDGNAFTEVGSTDSTSEVWINNTVTGTIEKESGVYPVRIEATSLAGGKKAYVDYLHLEFLYTRVGSLSHDTGNPDDSPDLESNSIAEGDTTGVFSATVCSGGYCGTVDSLLRANDSSFSDVDGISLASGDNPQTATLCEGDPEQGSCSTHAMSTEWEVTGDDVGAYGLDVESTSDYSHNGVNEPVSSESVLNVAGGSLAASVDVGKTTVLEGESFQATGTVTCDSAGGCAEVTVAVEREDDTPFDSDTLPFATSDTNPKSCGDLSDGEDCTKTWTLEATGEGTADHTVQVRGASSDGDIADATDATTVTIEAPSVSISGVSPAGSSSSLESTFDYSSNVDATVTCTLNGHESCSTAVGSTHGSTGSGSCTIGAGDYQGDNSLECEITNSTHGVSDTDGSGFFVEGAMTGADTGSDTVNPGDSITVYCPIENNGDIRYDGGGSSTGYSSLLVRLDGPSGETVEQESTDPTLGLDAGSGTTETESVPVPSDASEGDWSATCAKYSLIDSIVLSSTERSSGFTVAVEEEESTGLDVSILAPNPQKTYYSGQKVDIVVSVEDSGEDVTGATVTANGKTLRDDGTGADEQADDGLYSRSQIIPDTEGNYRLQANAEKGDRTGSASTILTVQDGFAIDSIQLDDVYRIGDTVQVNGTLDVNRELRNTTVAVDFINPSGTVVTTETDTPRSTASFTTAFTLRSGVSTGIWEARVTAKDDYDADGVTEQFEVEPPNPGAFYLNFLSRDRSRYQAGDDIRLELRPESSQTGETVSLESASCRVAGRKTALQQSESLYVGTITLPRNVTAGSYTVSCTCSRQFDGATRESTNSFSIDVEPIPLDVEILEPRGGVVSPGTNVTLRVNVTRQSRPAENATVSLVINGENTSVTLVPTGEPGIYTAQVAVPDRARSLRLKAADEQLNTGRSQPIAVSPDGGIDIQLFAIYAAILAVVSIIMYAVYRKYLYSPPLERQQKDLQRKLSSINESIQDTQRNYFNRKIDRDTFRRLMQKYEKEKTQIENELEEVNKEIRRSDDSSGGKDSNRGGGRG